MRSALLLALALAGPVLAQPLFTIDEGGQTNYFLQDKEAECHVIVRSEPPRVVFAFPSQNSGAAFVFKPGARLEGLDVHSEPDRTGQTVVLRARSQGSLNLRRTVLGSVRTLREEVEGPGADWVWKALAPQGVAVARGTSNLGRHTVLYTRPYLPGGNYQAVLSWPESVSAARSGEGYALSSKTPFELQFTVRVPHPPLGGPTFEELTSPAARALTEPRAREALRNLHFLVRGGKLMAGSWRFLTYFGRDTLLSLALLEPALSRPTLEMGLTSVLDRLSPAGDVAHEEEIGDWAVFRHLQLGQPPSDKPLYDYKMVDDDFLLPVISGRLASPAWLAAHEERVLANWKYVLDKAAAGPIRNVRGSNVGDWRDSQEGMGWGVYSGNVNHTLVPAALRAIAAMGKEWPGGEGMADRARGLLHHWSSVRGQYRVTLPPADIRERLRVSMQSLDPEEREFYLRRPVCSSSVSLRDFLAGQEAPALARPLSFLALSLTDDGKPVEVMNSDFSFLLFLGEPTRAEVDESLRLLELEYPVGLMTPVGPVVANPAYSLDPRHRRDLSRRAYHGAVIWAWQSAMIQAGLLRQWKVYGQDEELGPRLERVIHALERAEQNAGGLAASELWTHRVHGGRWEAVAFGADSGDQTESNALQLWSTVYPANVLRLKEAGL